MHVYNNSSLRTTVLAARTGTAANKFAAVLLLECIVAYCIVRTDVHALREVASAIVYSVYLSYHVSQPRRRYRLARQ